MLVVLLVASFALLPRIFSRQSGPLVGHEAPGFTLPVVADAGNVGASAHSVSLSDLKGHPVLLDFWATWCGPCRAQAPLVDVLFRRWRDQGLVVLGINTDGPDQGDPRAFALAHGLSYPILHDDTGAATRSYEVDSLPTLVVVSRTGKVVGVRTGITDDTELERLIRKAL